jgi:hypothetical protein
MKERTNTMYKTLDNVSPDTTVTVGMLKTAMADETQLVYAEDMERGQIEITRSKRRNRNRVLMILVAWIASLIWPMFALRVLNSPHLALYSASVGFTGDLFVTGYSWIKNY